MSNQKDCVSSSTLSLVASNSTFASKPATTAANGSDSNSSYLWPAYFVERPDGTFTALIEVDQLPDLIRIRGLPPKLSAAETIGMTSVGVKKESQRKYCIETADSSGKLSSSELSKHKAHGNTSVAPTITLSSIAPSDAAIALQIQGHPTTAAASSTIILGPKQEAVVVKPIPRKEGKVYCTYWIARGECHYAQQGCRFKHEMPNLETLGNIMGRSSFPKWWLDSIRPQRRNALLDSHRLAATNQQQGKRQESDAAPKLHPTKDTNSNSATENRNVVAQVPVEGLSSVMSKFIPRNGGELDMPSCIAVQSGSNMHFSESGPDRGNIRSSVSGRSGENNRSTSSDPSGSIVCPQISGSSGSEICSQAVSGPSNVKIHSTTSESAMIHGKQIVSNIRAPFSDPAGNSIIHSKQLGSNDRHPISGLTTDHSHKSSQASTSTTLTTQLVNNNCYPLSGTRSNSIAGNTQQPISNDDNQTTDNPQPYTLPTSPLHTEVPMKYKPQFHGAARSTVSSISSATPIGQSQINLPLRQSIWSPAAGKKIGGKGYTKTNTSETEGGQNQGVIPHNEGGETTRPYEEVFDLLGSF